MKEAITKHTVFEHFAGRITPLQRQTLQEWLRHPPNQQQYYAWLAEWEWNNLQYEIDGQAALEQFWRCLDEAPQYDVVPPAREVPLGLRRKRSFWRTLGAVAACVTLLAGGLYATHSYWYYRTVQTAYGEVRRCDLPDGSRVVLNANSSLRYPRFGFGSSTRRVALKGEGHFSVRHLPGHQRFEVQTDDGLRVVVLGTEFNLYARVGQSRVTLQRGRVYVVGLMDNRPRTLVMAPGDQVTHDARGGWSRQRTARPDLQSAWRERRFAFDRTSLADVARLLEETYGLHVVLTDPALAQRTVSGSFRAANATEFLTMVSQLLDVSYRQEGDTLIFVE